MKTIIISSSLSPNSRSFILCRTVYNRFRDKGINIEIIDARTLNLSPHHAKRTSGCMETLSNKIQQADNIIIGMGVHCYSINDSLKIILDNCFEGASGKLFGIICAAGGERSYLSTSHLTQICMNEWRMIQLPRIIYATSKDFIESEITSEEIHKRIDIFCNEFISIGKKLI